MSYTIFDFIGNIGVALIVVSFLLLQTGKIESRSVGYSVSNALGAVLIMVSLWTSFNWSVLIIEIFWLLISLYGLYLCISAKKELLSADNEHSSQ